VIELLSKHFLNFKTKVHLRFGKFPADHLMRKRNLPFWSDINSVSKRCWVFKNRYEP